MKEKKFQLLFELDNDDSLQVSMLRIFEDEMKNYYMSNWYGVKNGSIVYITFKVDLQSLYHFLNGTLTYYELAKSCKENIIYYLEYSSFRVIENDIKEKFLLYDDLFYYKEKNLNAINFFKNKLRIKKLTKI